MRSKNRVELIGNVTWNPELKHVEGNRAVCTFGLATNRNWTTADGEKKEATDYHRITAWGNLAEICNTYLTKGRYIYVEGRLHTSTWTDNEGVQRMSTEIVIDDMIMLDKKLPIDAVKEEPVQQVANHQENPQAATN
jgi:single-strand DNA-binding protein